MTKLSPSNAVNPAGAKVYGKPASVASTSKIYTAFKGESGNTVWIASQAMDDASPATQTKIPNGFVPGTTYSEVSAALFNGTLYVVITDKDGKLYITGGDPDNVAEWTLNEQIKSSNGTIVESTRDGAHIALLPEGDRLALYFTSHDSFFPRYLYSTDPLKAGTWGSTYDASVNAYTGSSQTINSDGAFSIAATTFHGKTVLAYNNPQAHDARLLTAKTFQPTGSNDWNEPTTISVTNTSSYSSPYSLTTDQSQLYMTGTSGYLDIFKPNPETWGQWQPNVSSQVYRQSPSDALANAHAFMANGQLKISHPASSDDVDLHISDVVLTTDGSTQQKSLAGYSIDGNLDVNGDGLADMLVSDPTDPSLAIDNQYVLFGGDYLNIANQVGTNGDDTLIGTPLADVIYTMAGDDTVISNGGADVIYTGAGADSISITGNSFFRIDAGDGIDTLLLEGDANQGYDFRLDVISPEYFAGTKLRNIELISSIDHGSNTLSFDSKAVRAFNDQRMLFLTPDNSDIINLSSDSDYGFTRNPSYDTNLGGVIWNAYVASAIGSSGTSDNLTLVYVLNPEPGDDNWLSDHIITTSATASPSTARLASPVLFGSPAPTSVSMQEESSHQPALSSAETPAPPTSSPVSYAVDFGGGLKLTAYKAYSTDAVVRFELSRSNTDQTQVVAYHSSSANSTADPGSHYTAIAGIIRFEPGQSRQTITVPLKSSVIQQLRSSQLSLQVEEIVDRNQQAIHLLIEPDDGSTDASALAPVLSSFKLEPSQIDNSALLTFRADVNTDTSDLKLSISQRDYADAATPTKVKKLQIADFSPSDQVKSIIDPITGSYRFDAQQFSNGHISTRFKLNFDPTSNQPVLALLGADNHTFSNFALSSDSEFSVEANQPLIAWRSDANPGEIDLALVSPTADRIDLLDQAAPSQDGSLNPSNLNNWIQTEGKAIGANSSFRSLPLAGHRWTPVASRDGVELNLDQLSIDGSQLTATFSGGIKVHLSVESTPKTPSQQPLTPEITVYRLGAYQNEIGFYRIDDLTGSIGDLNPGDSGYLQAALARAQEDGLFLTSQQLPAYSKTATFSDLAFDQNHHYGVILAVNGNHNNLFSSYSAANPNNAVQMVNLDSTTNPGCTTIGIEDLAYNPNNSTTSDFNDIILKILHNHQIAIF